MGGPACECERAGECAGARARRRPPAWAGAGCHENAPRPELIISCGKCAGGAGAGRAEEAAAWSCLPPAGRVGRAPGSAATPGSCLRQAGESGTGAGGGRAGLSGSARPTVPGAASGPALPAGPPPLPGPLRGAGKAGPGRSSPAWSPAAPLRRSAGAEDLAHSTAWGGTSPGVAAASGPPFRSLWPGRAETDLGTSCPLGPPPPLAEIPPHPPGIP